MYDHGKNHAHSINRLPGVTGAALSLLDDYTSLPTRFGAAQYLVSHHDYPDQALRGVWRALSHESDAQVSVAIIDSLGQLADRGASSLPLITYYLQDSRDLVSEAAARALVSLSVYMPYAIIPLWSGELKSSALAVRERYVDDAIVSNNIQLAEVIREAKWVAQLSSNETKNWISNLSTGGFDQLEPRDKLRFLLIFSDPQRQTLYKCVRMLRVFESVGYTWSSEAQQQFAMCAGNLARDVANIKLLLEGRYFAQGLLTAEGWAASLSDIVGAGASQIKVKILTGELLSTASEPEKISANGLASSSSTTSRGIIRLHATAVSLSPQTPPEESVDALIDCLWDVESEYERNLAFLTLSETLPIMNVEASEYLVKGVVTLLNSPPELLKPRQILQFSSQIASVLLKTPHESLPTLLNAARVVCEGRSPYSAKHALIKLLVRLSYSDWDESFAVAVKQFLEEQARSTSPALSKIAGEAARSLNRKIQSQH